jgi:hypothetical protein
MTEQPIFYVVRYILDDIIGVGEISPMQLTLYLNHETLLPFNKLDEFNAIHIRNVKTDFKTNRILIDVTGESYNLLLKQCTFFFKVDLDEIDLTMIQNRLKTKIQYTQ